ncbi:kinesin-like protein Klp61F isoform X2 [Plodia interpunctella]|uniref:kinesin-like protein Klp61F isoform X2 n=1 Tax=Plodia interpunctella TaxID=58824 RepID=UPI0023685B78|nr:kinesin-like protein Klp61F isoform X2 [Plodia interpunctella]
MAEKGNRKEKNQNIQVFVRLRPLNQRERDIKSLGVVEVANNREVVVRQSQQTSLTKKFTFDRAFGPHTKQVEVYQEVVSPLIEEVLAGYNCTVFAYGQTGTGKTHTMVGENTSEDTTWQNDPLAGIIPRALSQLFDELRISNTEYTVRVSYLELYNEELFDLLATSEDNSKLRIYEDVTRKGSNIVNGLEEITVYNKNEVYKIMAQGQERKRVASTLMNAQSSRSHTVFTIVVHMKENSPEGEELVKIGKLNLVDLAGSENISKAGSDNPAKRERARECVNINQSLLTLGRVITALVERHPHIPYRESKLTRILQESLGGKTKTSIIATISPGHKDLEETMSTLEYAHRAKNIQNRPEVNQKMTKKAILKEYAEEIDRLKRDLQAARDKSGVYLANETYAEMTLKQEEQRKEIQELLLKKKAMEDERDRMLTVFEELQKKIEERETQLNAAKNKLDDTQAKLVNTSNILRTTKLHFEEQKHLVSKQVETELKLSAQARQLLHAADVASSHVACLHDTVDRRKTVESTNLELTRLFRSQSTKQRSNLAARVNEISHTLINTLDGLLTSCDNYTSNTAGIQEENRIRIEELVQKINDAMVEIKAVTATAVTQLQQSHDEHTAALRAALDARARDVERALTTLLQAVARRRQRAGLLRRAAPCAALVHVWYTDASTRMQSLNQSYVSFVSAARHNHATLRDAALRHRHARALRSAARTDSTAATIEEIEEMKASIESRLERQLLDIETERQHSQKLLHERMQHEAHVLQEHRKEIEIQRKILDEQEKRLAVREERLARQYEDDKQALEDRISKMTQDIEAEKKSVEELTAQILANQRQQLEEDKRDIDSAEADMEEVNVGTEALSKCLDKFSKEFEEGTSAVNIDMEAFSKKVVEVADQVSEQLMDAITETHEQIQTDTRAALDREQSSRDALCAESARALALALQRAQLALAGAQQRLEQHNITTIQELTHLASSANELGSQARNQLASQSDAVAAGKKHLETLQDEMKDSLERHAELEETYLSREYKVYNPTGSTPARSEYALPRALASTSPHARILARYRALARPRPCALDNSPDDRDVASHCWAKSLCVHSISGQCLTKRVKLSKQSGHVHRRSGSQKTVVHVTGRNTRVWTKMTA